MLTSKGIEIFLSHGLHESFNINRHQAPWNGAAIVLTRKAATFCSFKSVHGFLSDY